MSSWQKQKAYYASVYSGAAWAYAPLTTTMSPLFALLGHS